uniref:FHA domain-containing protein n=1 Tax=Rhabditophanes sp. KR3021 TaxID=114890 RepID=A0AC35U6V8_9BILA
MTSKYSGPFTAAFVPCVESHVFDKRVVAIPNAEEYAIKIGRSVGKLKPQPDNSIFDCKVLSRNHAIIWYEDNNFFIKDTKSSNGTYVNNERLSKTGEESPPRVIYPGDIIQFGVEIIDNSNKIASGCIITLIQFYNSEGREMVIDRPIIKKTSRQMIAEESDNSKINVTDGQTIDASQLFQLQQYVKEAVFREKILTQKIHSLQDAVISTSQAAEASWAAMINEESMLSRIELLENQLTVYSKTLTVDQAKLDLKKILAERAVADKLFKDTLQKVYSEKIAALEREQSEKFKNEALHNDILNLENQIIEHEARNKASEDKHAKLLEKFDSYVINFEEQNKEFSVLVEERKELEKYSTAYKKENDLVSSSSGESLPDRNGTSEDPKSNLSDDGDVYNGANYKSDYKDNLSDIIKVTNAIEDAMNFLDQEDETPYEPPSSEHIDEILGGIREKMNLDSNSVLNESRESLVPSESTITDGQNQSDLSDSEDLKTILLETKENQNANFINEINFKKEIPTERIKISTGAQTNKSNPVLGVFVGELIGIEPYLANPTIMKEEISSKIGNEEIKENWQNKKNDIEEKENNEIGVSNYGKKSNVISEAEEVSMSLHDVSIQATIPTELVSSKFDVDMLHLNKLKTTQQLLLNKGQLRRLSSLKGDEYEYLQQSKIPTLHFQKSLPRLPIPKLEDTKKRYLNAVRAVASEKDYKCVESLITDFFSTNGKSLQDKLIAHDNSNKHTSFISEPWFDMYLSSRLPCPVNFNPFMMYAADKTAAQNEQVARASNFAISYARFKKSLDTNVLEPEIFHMAPAKSKTKKFVNVCRNVPEMISWYCAYLFKAFPLDMSQYGNLMGGTRIPEIEKDKLFVKKDSRHFVVMKGGKFYTVNIFDDKNNLRQPEEIHAVMAHLCQKTETISTDSAVGSLTTLDRDTWAKARINLLRTAENGCSLAEIDSALFIICLDDSNTTDHQELVKSLLIGNDGSNRWFDKCFQLIVDKNGQATINFEHSWGDGVAVLRLMEESLKDTQNNKFVLAGQKVNPEVDVSNLLKELKFNLTTDDKNSIVEAQKLHSLSTKNLEFATMEYNDLNRDVLKQFKVSPDAIMQLAIQLAYYKTYKEFVPTYESSSTSAFRKGRTECVRSATCATRDAVLAFVGKNSGNLHRLIRQCSDVHSQLVKEAAMGQGVDRHLLGLKIMAERLGEPIPDFYKNETVVHMNHYVLSTSTLSTETIVFGGFGPVVHDGFGIGYNVASDKMGAVISAFKHKKDAPLFANALSEGLDEIKHALTSTK